MALDIQRMLGQLSPARPIDLGGAGGRQQLRLQREEFEWRKKNAQEQRELQLLQEQNEMARAQMQDARLRAEEQAKAEAVKQAALLAQQQAALGKAGELAGTGKAQQLAAMSPLFDQLGYDMNSLGSVGGLPVYDFVNRAQAQQAEDQAFEQGPRPIDSYDGSESATQSLARLSALGYPTNERGNLEDGTGASRSAVQLPVGEQVDVAPQVGGVDESVTDALTPGEADLATAEEMAGADGGVADVSVGGRGLAPASLSTGDAFARALAAQRYALETGRPARGPDEEDYMGAVPRNRIDMGAMAAETLKRLNPALQARVAALPPELQEAAKRNAAAIGGLGLEATDALAEQDKSMDDAVSIYNSQQNLLAEKEKRNTPSMMDISTYGTRGEEKARTLAKERGVSNVLDAVVKADEVLRVLDDPSPENDRMIAPALMAAQGVEGVPSNTDLQFAFNAKSSLIGDIIAKVEEAIQGGLSTAQRRAIRDYLKATKESQRRTVEGFLDNAFQRLDSGELNEYEARGYKGYIEQSVPASWYNDYWDKREKAGGAGGQRTTGQSMPTGDLDPEKLGRVIGRESGGDAAAESSAGARGTMQIMPDNLRAMGIEPEAFAKLSPAEQMPYNVRYLKERGITKDSSAEDYALAVAAPTFIGKPPETVVYPKDSAAWKENPGWRPADGGDITVGSILKFYGLGGADKGADRKADASNPYPDDAKADELLKRVRRK